MKPPCKNGDPCHERAPRGSRHGLQGIKGADNRAVYPKELCEHIVDVCENYICRWYKLWIKQWDATGSGIATVDLVNWGRWLSVAIYHHNIPVYKIVRW